jgi:hypothetical protein
MRQLIITRIKEIFSYSSALFEFDRYSQVTRRLALYSNINFTTGKQFKKAQAVIDLPNYDFNKLDDVQLVDIFEIIIVCSYRQR